MAQPPFYGNPPGRPAFPAYGQPAPPRPPPPSQPGIGMPPPGPPTAAYPPPVPGMLGRGPPTAAYPSYTGGAGHSPNVIGNGLPPPPTSGNFPTAPKVPFYPQAPAQGFPPSLPPPSTQAQGPPRPFSMHPPPPTGPFPPKPGIGPPPSNLGPPPLQPTPPTPSGLPASLGAFPPPPTSLPGSLPPRPSVPFYQVGGGGALQQSAPQPTGPPTMPGGMHARPTLPPPPTGPPPTSSTDPMAQQAYGPGYGAMRPPPGIEGQPAGYAPMLDGQGANPLPSLAEIDLSVQSDPRYMRFTVGKVPNSQNNAASIKLPLGVVIQPMALDHKGEEDINIVNFGATGIIRCKKCRTYINPFVSWLDNGRRWRCNVCGTVNDVPSAYFHHLDAKGQRRDKSERPELCSGSVEFVAPGEYMVRPPQPPVYVFVLDVSMGAVASGMVGKAIETIKQCLDDLPGDPRTQFGLISFDTTVHFYNLKPSLKMPQVLVIPDIAELFVPMPDDLLVNLKESRDVIDMLLDSLPAMLSQTRTIDCCLGPALTAAYRVMATVGGKMVVFCANLPTLGEGRLKHREDPRALGTEREHGLLNADDAWYRSKAVEFSRVQISVDLFLTSANYTDVASLANLAKFTGGNLYHYPGFTLERDGGRFSAELRHLLTRPTGFEAVMRVRVTRGLKITQFYGNYYIRGTDLLALPNCSSESVFAIELGHDEAFLTASVICVQAALLHTTSNGERRIRVHTLAAPVTAILQDIIASVDQDALCNLIAKRSLDVALKSGLDSSRMRLQQQCADIIRSCRGFAAQAPGQPPQVPRTLELLPLYTMALSKNVCFRGGQEIRPDFRVYMMHLLGIMNVDTSRVFIYPRLFALHEMDNECGRPLNDDQPFETSNPPPHAGRNNIRLPPVINLSAERFISEGLYLLENGISLYLWVGARADPTQLSALFGVPSLEGMDAFQLQQRVEDQESRGSDLNKRVNDIIQALREDRSMRHLTLQVVMEGDMTAAPFYWNLVEDRAPFPGGAYNYAEYMTLMNRPGYGPGHM